MADVGEIPVVVGIGLSATFTVKTCALEVPPPGPEFVTVMKALVVATLISAVLIIAVNWVAETKVVDLGDPLKLTVETPLIKLVPLTISEKSVSPTVLKVGTMPVVVGIELLTVKVCALEVPPPGVVLKTVIKADEVAVVISLARIETVS